MMALPVRIRLESIIMAAIGVGQLVHVEQHAQCPDDGGDGHPDKELALEHRQRKLRQLGWRQRNATSAQQQQQDWTGQPSDSLAGR